MSDQTEPLLGRPNPRASAAGQAVDEVRRNAMLEAETSALRRFARALASDADAAADLTQDTLAQALKAWAQWRGDGPLRAWLFAIMRNLNRAQAARQARWRAITVAPAPGAEEGEPIEARLPAPPEVDPVYLGEVGAAMARLPDEQREVLALVAVEGFSYQEAADLLETPIGTVMSRLSRARAKLRAEVEPIASPSRADARRSENRPNSQGRRQE